MALDVETDDIDGAKFFSGVGLLDVTDVAEVVDVVDSFTETLGTVQRESVTGIIVCDNTNVSQERDCNKDQAPRGVPQETSSNSTL
jgi:hypothetical protein